LLIHPDLSAGSVLLYQIVVPHINPGASYICMQLCFPTGTSYSM